MGRGDNKVVKKKKEKEQNVEMKGKWKWKWKISEWIIRIKLKEIRC